MLVPNAVQIPADRLVSVHRQAALVRRGFAAGSSINNVIAGFAWPSRDREPVAFNIVPAGLAPTIEVRS